MFQSFLQSKKVGIKLSDHIYGKIFTIGPGTRAVAGIIVAYIKSHHIYRVIFPDRCLIDPVPVLVGSGTQLVYVFLEYVPLFYQSFQYISNLQHVIILILVQFWDCRSWIFGLRIER